MLFCAHRGYVHPPHRSTSLRVCRAGEHAARPILRPIPRNRHDHAPLLPPSRTRLTTCAQTHFLPLPSSLPHAYQRLLRLFTQVDCRYLLRPAQAIARAIALPVALSHATKVPMSRCLSADLARLQYGLTAFAATSLPTSPSPTTRRVGLPAMTSTST